MHELGRDLDVLVNNAANFYGGFFEQPTPEQIDRQMEANPIGPMNVTRGDVAECGVELRAVEQPAPTSVGGIRPSATHLRNVPGGCPV